MFRWLRGPAHPKESPVASMFVLTSSLIELDLLEFARQVLERLPGPLAGGQLRDEGSTVAIDLPEGALGFAIFDGRLDLLDQALAAGELSVLGGAEPLAEGYRAAILVTLGRTSSSQAELARLTSLLALELLRTVDGAGVFVPSSGVVCTSAQFCDGCGSPGEDELPLLAWIGIRFFHNGGRLSAATRGLRAFGLRELVVTGSGQEPAELAAHLYDLAQYQIDSRGALQSGESFGFGPTQRIRVAEALDPFVPDQRALYFGI